MPELNTLLANKLQQRRQENAFRQLVRNNQLIDFTSNDYLGLARSERLFQLIHEKVNTLPHLNGATGSRLLSGNTEYTEQVEQKLAKILKAEAALIFNSGYAANQAVLSCIPQKHDTIIYDEFAHACIRDGARLSFANHFSFRHNDLTDLEKKLKQASGTIFIVVESFYSMDGDICPVNGLVSLAERYDANVIIDEAHSTGIMGPGGSGFSVALKLHDKLAIRIYTFGKAMGCHGACVVGSKTLIDYLVNFARPFIFTTAMPLHSLAAIDCSFDYLAQHIDLQQELQQKKELFVSLAKMQNLNVMNSSTQIQGMILPRNGNVKAASRQLQARGYDVRPILSPTVPKGSERLRICLHTHNPDAEIRNLVKELDSLA